MEESIGERLRRLRLGKDWTQNVLGYHAGRAPSVISQVETGKREPELSTVKALAGALGIDWKYLLLGDETPKAEAPNANASPGQLNGVAQAEAWRGYIERCARRWERMLWSGPDLGVMDAPYETGFTLWHEVRAEAEDLIEVAQSEIIPTLGGEPTSREALLDAIHRLDEAQDSVYVRLKQIIERHKNRAENQGDEESEARFTAALEELGAFEPVLHQRDA